MCDKITTFLRKASLKYLATLFLCDITYSDAIKYQAEHY